MTVQCREYDIEADNLLRERCKKIRLQGMIPEDLNGYLRIMLRDPKASARFLEQYGQIEVSTSKQLTETEERMVRDMFQVSWLVTFSRT